MSESDYAEFTFYNPDGSISYHFKTLLAEADTATQEEVDEMVMMIEGGYPAYLAYALVKQGKP
jgi:hypothetical protein